MKILDAENKNSRLALAGFCISLLFLLSIFFVQVASAFIGPTAPPPGGRGNFIDASGKYLSIGSSSYYFHNLYIFAPDSNSAHYSLKVTDELLNPILRVRNDGITAIGDNITFKTTPFKYDLQVESIYSPSFKSPYAYSGRSGVNGCSGASSLYMCDTVDVGTFLVSETPGETELFSLIPDDLGGYGAITGFRNLGSVTTTVNIPYATLPASNTYPGVFGFSGGGGNYIFWNTSMVGVNTSSHLFSNPTSTLMVYGSGYFSTSSLSVGMTSTINLASTSISTGFGSINVTSSPSWLSGWKKAIRVEDYQDGSGAANESAIEFGGGGTTKYGIAKDSNSINPYFFIFSTPSEYDPTVFAQSNKTIRIKSTGEVGIGTNPSTEVLRVAANSTTTTLSVGRATGKSSILARGALGFSDSDIAINSNGSGALYLNPNHLTGNVIFAAGGGSVAIGTSTASGIALNVSGTLKTASFKLGSSATAGNVLTATGAADGTGSWSSASGNITGTSTSLYDAFVVKWGGANLLTDSVIYGGGSGIGIGLGQGFSPTGKLSVSGGVSIGSYAGVNTPPLNGAIVSDRIGINTSTPEAALQINDPTAPTLILRKTYGLAGSIRIFTTVDTATTVTLGNAICQKVRPRSVCWARFNSLKNVLSCGSVSAVSPPHTVLCLDLND